MVATVRRQFLQTFRDQKFAVLAYTFMPDHVHLLVEGTSDASDFRRAVTMVRRRTTLACHTTLRPLWQDGYYERVLRRDEDSLAVISYILNNPVRAGLVERAVDFPNSWSVTL
jgi:REP element-mobilizing transposase RayT